LPETTLAKLELLDAIKPGENIPAVIFAAKITTSAI
jgi:hypothetical protein